MRAHLLKWIQDIRSSYWFVPSLMVLAAILLAYISSRIDTFVDTSFLSSISWLYESQPAGARAVLSAIGTSMIGVAGVTFSMTIVTVSFAASNIGPRLIGNFMRDTGNQVTLGTFIATFVYCLLILRTVTDASGDNSAAYVPHISLLIALGLALLSVGNLIYFIHHIPESINVARIAYLIATDLQVALKQLFPKDVGHAQGSAESREPEFGPTFRVESQTVRAPETGYLQVIDDEALMEVAQSHDLVLRVEYRPGDFTPENSVLLYANPSARVDEAVAKKLTGCFVLGPKRTVTQNAMFLVDQLVEIMMRALSPGVNDPFTAVGCLDWLQAGLTISIERAEPNHCRYDADGQPRVAVHAISFERLASAVFEQPLQYVASDRTAALKMMQVIAELVAISDTQVRTDLLLAHARRLNEAGQQCLPVRSDQLDLRERFEQTARIAQDPVYGRLLRDDQGWLGGRG